MKKAAEYLKENKNILIVGVLIFILILAVALINAGGGDGNAASSDSLKSQEEIKLTRILSELEGVGDAEVMITSDDEGVKGVVIVCEGAENIMVRSSILNVVSTALNIDKNNIAIYAMN